MGFQAKEIFNKPGCAERNQNHGLNLNGTNMKYL